MKHFLSIFLTFIFSTQFLFAQIKKGTTLIDFNFENQFLETNFPSKQYLYSNDARLTLGRFLKNEFLVGFSADYGITEIINEGFFFNPFNQRAYKRFTNLIRTKGINPFIRYYRKPFKEKYIYFFGHAGYGRYWHKAESGFDNDIFEDFSLEASVIRLGAGVTAQIDEGIFLEVTSIHPIWKNKSNDSFFYYTELRRELNWNISARLSILLNPEKQSGLDVQPFQKGDKTFGMNTRVVPDSSSVTMIFNPTWFLSRNVAAGFQIPIRIYPHENVNYYEVGFGPSLRLYTPVYNRFIFFTDVRISVLIQRRFNSSGTSTTSYSITQSIGMNYFLYKSLALEGSVRRDFNWVYYGGGEKMLPKDIFRLQFNFGLRYFFRHN